MKKQVFLVFPVVYNVQDLYRIHCCIEILPKNVFCLICESDGRRIKLSGIGIFCEYSCSENTHLFGMRKLECACQKSE